MGRGGGGKGARGGKEEEKGLAGAAGKVWDGLKYTRCLLSAASPLALLRDLPKLIGSASSPALLHL